MDQVGDGGHAGLGERLARWQRRSERLSRALPAWFWLGLLAAFFLGAAYLAVRELELTASAVAWLPLLLALVLGVPATAVANALEYRFSARLTGRRIGLPQAFRVAIAATAANMLPLPGGPLVRVAALQRSGATGKAAVTVTAGVAGAWVGVALVIAGIALGTQHDVRFGTLASLVGALALGAAWWLLRREGGVGPRSLAELLAIEVLSVLATAFRLLLLLVALGVGWRPGDATVLAVSGVLATSLGIVPAGIGVKEALTSGLAVLVGLSSATGLVVSVLDRLVGLVGHALLVGAFFRRAVWTADRSGPAD